MERIDAVAGRKLALDKETLRTLGDAELRDVAGGIPITISIVSPISLSAVATITISIITRTTNPSPPEEPTDPEDTGSP